MIGVSPRMQRVFRLIEKVAPTESTVPITGEKGPGRDGGDRHPLQSRRAHRPYVIVNAAAIPESLFFESELFATSVARLPGPSPTRWTPSRADGGRSSWTRSRRCRLPCRPLLRALQNGEVRRVGDWRDRASTSA
jgi:DNA-binding NtrC family response regulator